MYKYKYKLLNIYYCAIILYIIKIQRSWRKYRYGKRKNITKLLINRQINNKISIEKYISKHQQSINPLHNYGDIEIIFSYT